MESGRKESEMGSIEKNKSGVRLEGNQLTACLNRIFNCIDNNGLNADTENELAREFQTVGEKFHISGKSAVILAAVLENDASCHGIDDEDLAKYIGCSNIEFISMKDYISELLDNGIISIASSRGRHKSYCVSPQAASAIVSDRQFTPVKRTDLTVDELFAAIQDEVTAVRHGEHDNDQFLESMDRLVEENRHLDFCRKVYENAVINALSDTERRFFYYLCHKYVNHGEQNVELVVLMNLTGYMDNDTRLKRLISMEKTDIQQKGIVVFGIENGFVDNERLSLSDEIRENLFSEVQLAVEPQVKHKDMICWETIKTKDLFFNSREEEQIERLGALLQDENFRQVQARLEEMGMRKGFNAIFYGGPGTGKTACVYELARKTGRDIFCIDMSKLKSKWVGDSEKAVKGAFHIYKQMVSTNSRAPIMLFNEADAIFSKRLENVTDSVDQMMNAIQNIILQEMENIDGILVATTNLVGNLDPAFERRFIFKLHFEKPAAQVRSRIWKSMVSGLSDSDADRLAGEFDFSGGNIENITRKSTIDYVLTGERPNYEKLEKYCREETLGEGKTRSIGF